MKHFPPPLSDYSTTLVVDFNGTAAIQLANQLSHSGFHADVAVSSQAARAAVRAKDYTALVMVADLNHSGDVECLSGLRKSARRSWIIVVSSRLCPDPHQIILRCGADSLLIAPFSIEELARRLSTFSLRSRPP